MTKWLQIAMSAVFALSCSVTFAQNGADLLDDFAAEVDVVASDAIESASDLDVDALAMDSDDVKILNVRLQDNGKLSGRLQVYYPTGKSEPANAKVAFTQSGQLVSSTRTDDLGHFHVEGLEPGDYTATASLGEASTDFQVKVLAFDENAAPEEMFLEGTLTPIPSDVGGEVIVDGGGCVDCGCSDCGGGIIQDEVIVNEGIVYDEGIVMDEGIPCDSCGVGEEIIVDESIVYDEGIVDMGCGCDTGFAPTTTCGSCGGGAVGGGGGIGRRGFGGLLGVGLGAAGLAAGIADDDDVVSPSSP